MAKRTITTLTDDIDGSEASETVTFGLDGITYEVDLNDVHAEDLRAVLAPFISVARKVSASAGRRRGPARAVPVKGVEDVDNRAVRSWAKAHGIDVSSRGRIRGDVIERYLAAGR